MFRSIFLLFQTVHGVSFYVFLHHTRHFIPEAVQETLGSRTGAKGEESSVVHVITVYAWLQVAFGVPIDEAIMSTEVLFNFQKLESKRKLWCAIVVVCLPHGTRRAAVVQPAPGHDQHHALLM